MNLWQKNNNNNNNNNINVEQRLPSTAFVLPIHIAIPTTTSLNQHITVPEQTYSQQGVQLQPHQQQQQQYYTRK